MAKVERVETEWTRSGRNLVRTMHTQYFRVAGGEAFGSLKRKFCGNLLIKWRRKFEFVCVLMFLKLDLLIGRVSFDTGNEGVKVPAGVKIWIRGGIFFSKSQQGVKKSQNFLLARSELPLHMIFPWRTSNSKTLKSQNFLLARFARSGHPRYMAFLWKTRFWSIEISKFSLQNFQFRNIEI